MNSTRSRGCPTPPRRCGRCSRGASSKGTEPATLAVVLQHLNVPPHEIREILRTLTADNYLWKMLPQEGAQEAPLSTPVDEAWQSLRSKLLGRQEVVQAVLGVLVMSAQVLGVDIAAEVSTLGRKPQEG